MSMLKRFNDAGETIVEILICTAIVSIAISAAYVSGVHAIKAIQSAREKEDAITVARTQIELMAVDKNFIQNDSSYFSTIGGCYVYIKDINSDIVVNDSATPNNGCTNYGQGQSPYSENFSVSIKKSSTNPTLSQYNYDVKVTWSGSTGISTLDFYYIRKVK